MILRYKIDNAILKARLRHDTDASGAGVAWLVVTYGDDHVVCPWEARRDLELVYANRLELEELRAAGYDIPFAAGFTEVAA